ncbi:MAG TPA: energy transducer TonB [Longimicrobiaceae bacterium]|nr:energy transducer TonB [Longimicrobiaceae bacterium]
MPVLVRHAALAAALLLSAACERGPVPESPPRQVSQSPFQYPEELWDAQVEGQTTLRLFISDEGTVDTVRIEQGSGYAAFDSAALAGSRALRFQPATRGGKAVAAWFLLPVKFELNPADSAAAAPSADTAKK